MTTRYKNSGKASSTPASIGIGVLVSLLWTCICAAFTAKMIDLGKIDESIISYCSMGILLTSAIIGSWIAMKKAKHKRIQISLFTGTGYYLSLLAVTALFFDGQYTAMGVTAMLILGGSLAAAVAEEGSSRKRNNAHYPKMKK